MISIYCGQQTSHLRFRERHERHAWFRSRTFFVGGVVDSREGIAAEDETDEEEEAEDWKPLIPVVAGVVVAAVAVFVVVVFVVVGVDADADADADAAVIDDVELSSGRLTGIDEEGGTGEGIFGGSFGGSFDGAATVMEFRAEWEGEGGLAAIVVG